MVPREFSKSIDKKTIEWGWLLGILVLMCSCQNIGSKPQNLTAQTKIDTSKWLKTTRGIRDILEDKQGNLWFASSDYIAKYDGKSLKYFAEAEGLKTLGNLHVDKRGVVWVENGINIYRYNGVRFEATNLLSKATSNASPEPSFWIQRGIDFSDTSYVAPGFYAVTQVGAKFYPFPIKKKANNKYKYFPSTKVYVGKNGTVWASTMEKAFGLKNNTFISIGREEMGRQNDQRQMGIRGIFLDSKGKLWIADNGAGVFVYDGQATKNFTKTHRLDKGNVKGNTLHRAFSIAEDSLGNMWFGTVYSGIWRYNTQTKVFTNYTKDDGVKSDNIWTIYKTKKGELLFAGESPAAVYKFNGKGFDRVH